MGGSLEPGSCPVPRKQSLLGPPLLWDPVGFCCDFLLLAGHWVLLSTGGHSGRKWGREDGARTCSVHGCGYAPTMGCAVLTGGW